jgi:hypothetical protein
LSSISLVLVVRDPDVVGSVDGEAAEAVGREARAVHHSAECRDEAPGVGELLHRAAMGIEHVEVAGAVHPVGPRDVEGAVPTPGPPIVLVAAAALWV